MGNDSKMILERVFVAKGSLAFEEGDEGACAFLIQSGAVSIFTERGGLRVELARLEAGQIFGELALLNEGKRRASVVALSDCTLIVITRQVLEEKLRKTDPTVRALVEMLSARILSSNDVVADKQDDIEDLTGAARVIYQNILVNLPPNRQKEFNADVLPKLNAFFDAMRAFQKVHY